MITRKNILYSTFIGLPVEIPKCTDTYLQGVKGKVVDETKNMLIIEKSDGKEIKLQKVACIFRFTLDDKTTVDVDGSKICFRPEERPKKV